MNKSSDQAQSIKIDNLTISHTHNKLSIAGEHNFDCSQEGLDSLKTACTFIDAWLMPFHRAMPPKDSLTPGFDPFGNDSQSVQLEGLTVENGTDSLKLYGQQSYTDRVDQDVNSLMCVSHLLRGAILKLTAMHDLPEKLDPIEPTTGDNPFA